MSAPATDRRPPGTGSLDVRVDRSGRESWYGRWTHEGVRVKRRIGPKRVPSTRDGLTRAQAERELRRLMSEARPRPAPGERLTIGAVGARYLDHLEARGRKHATVVGVEMALRVHLVPFFAEKPIDKIRTSDIEELVALQQRRGLSAKSIRTYIGTLSALFNYAAAPQRQWVAHNPARGVELPPKQDNQDIRFLDPDEVASLVRAAIPGPYQQIDRALYLTAAMTGLRQGELVALRWRDVDWPAARIRVRQNYVLGQFGTPKSRRSTRSVPMADRVAGELDRLYKVSGQPTEDDLVFADIHTGGPLSKPAILRRFRKALAAAGLDETRRFHDLRHTFGTAMAATGLPMRTLQEWMGHRDIATTQIYADYSPSSHEAAYIQEAFGSTDSSLRASEQITGRDSEAAGDLDDCGDAQVADAALGSADLDGVHPRAVGESFLGDPEALAVDADVLADLQLGLHRGDPRP
ncbi:MAG TPA: tyrosine-type recombinase/integrase [Solirubrobacteraceae bacterium]|nr:tyrosine-type recombinase/integrase [Solirubrobacteraceae bacterium]